MSVKILKPIKRFWRGLTKRMRAAVILLTVSALLLAGFGIYLLVRPTDTVERATSTLFPAVDRTGIESVLCHTKSGSEYTVKGSFYTVTDVNGDPQTYKRFYIVTPDGTAEGHSHNFLTLNATKLSYFVVGTGKNYVFSPVISAPESGAENYGELLSAYEAKKKELGFSDDSPYYELKTTSGDVYRVYYGIKDVTGAGYYVRLDGEETIYATKSAFVGDLLGETGPESLIDPTLFIPSQNKYAYAYPQSYSMYDFTRVKEAGTVVSSEYYSVGYTLIDEDGNRLQGDLPLEKYEGTGVAARLYREAVIDFFMGKSIGECNEEFTFKYPDTQDVEEELRGDTVTIFVETIDYVTKKETRLALRYLPKLQRELSQKLSVYAYTAPADITSYIPDSNALLTMLEDVLGLTGTVIKLGLDDDTMTKYGLYRHQIWFRYPGGTTITATGSVNGSGDDADALAEEKYFADDDNFLEGRLYVSDVTENGTRYVASIFYDLVVEVDDEALAFLDQSPLELVDDFMITTPITDIESFTMYWNYGEGKWLSSAYRFDVTVKKVASGGFTGEYDENGKPIRQPVDVVTKIVATPLGGGDPIVFELPPDKEGKPQAYDPYHQLYSRLTYTHYQGEHGLSDEALAALLGNSDNCVLRFEQTLTDGTVNFWEFYPMSANRVVVQVKNGSQAKVGARFYIYGTAFADITSAYLRFIEGKAFDYEQRYE